MSEVKSYYTVLLSTPDGVVFPWKSVWKTQAPPRVVLFSRTATLGKLLMGDNLRKRGMIVVDWYFMCKAKGRQWNIFFCTVLWQQRYGIFFLFYILSLLDYAG